MKSKAYAATKSGTQSASLKRVAAANPTTRKGGAGKEAAISKDPKKEGAGPKDGDRRSERRQKIVECAARQFAERGFDECDMDCVAAKVGVAKGTLYLYFPGKQDLFFACVDWGMTEMQRKVREAAAGVDDPVQKMARGIRAYLEYFETHPEQVELLIQERAIFRDRKRPTYFEYRDANRGPWRELYLGLVKQGRMRGDVSVERILDAIGSLLYGTMFTNHFVGRTISLDEQYRALLAIIFRGTAVKGTDLGE